MRVLLGLSDTEGTPHKPSNDSELWNAVIVFKYVVDTEEMNHEEIFHVTHLAINK